MSKRLSLAPVFSRLPVVGEAWRWLAAIALIGTVVIGSLATDQPRVRYVEYPNHYQMIFRQTGPVDLAVIGSSRSMRVFQGELLTRYVQERHGYTPVIYDLSRAYRDNGHMTSMIEDLLSQRQVKMLLVEFKETGSQWRHPFFERTVTFANLAESFWSRPSASLVERAREQLFLVATRVEARLTALLTERLRLPPEAKVTTAAGRDPSQPYFVKSDVVMQKHAQHAATWRDQPLRSIDLDAAEEERSRFYVEKLVRLASNAGTQIIFYHIPSLYGMPFDESFVQSFTARFHAPLIQLPMEDLAAIYPYGFTDGNHMGWFAAERYMRKLAVDLPWRNP